MTNNSWNSSTPVTVNMGGTGKASFSVNGALISNTTITGALASIALASQKFLVGNAAAAPTAKSLVVNVQFFIASGTYTPITGMVYCIVEALGGGGGGGGAADSSATNNGSIACGGGGGEYRLGFYDAAAIGASQTVTINSGGAAGSAGGATGGAGGTGGSVTFGALITCNGGTGGNGAPLLTTPLADGVDGGSGGSGGVFFVPGQSSYGGWGVGTQGSCLLNGANSMFGRGGRGIFNGNAANAAGCGAGGGGCSNLQGQVGHTGGTGTNGCVVVTEFILA